MRRSSSRPDSIQSPSTHWSDPSPSRCHSNAGPRGFPSSVTGPWPGNERTERTPRSTFRARSQTPAWVRSLGISSAPVESQNESSIPQIKRRQTLPRRTLEAGPDVASTDLTLAVSLSTVERLAQPDHALEDAATWASHVGIVSSEPSYIERRRVREAGYHQEFLSGPRSVAEALSAIRGYFGTERYVFVGADETSGAVETVPDWTYQSVADAAIAADWRLSTPFTVNRD